MRGKTASSMSAAFRSGVVYQYVMFLAAFALLWVGSAFGANSVYFIGNSFTATYDIPGVFNSLAASGGHTASTDGQIIGGYSLTQHWNDGVAAADITAGNFDYVVLQENSALPYDTTIQTAFNSVAPLFDAVSTNSGAQTILYMPWVRETELASLTNGIAIYLNMADQLGAMVSPVGIAWKRVMEQQPSLDLYDADRHHPNPKGSYLSACCFYGAIFNESPEGLAFRTVGGFVLDASAAAFIQRVAWDAVQSLSFTNPPVASITVDQAVQTNSTPFSFHVSATDDGSIVDYLWDFGDGTTTNGAALTNVTHAYAVDGLYLVTVKATDNTGETDRVGLSVVLDTVGPQVAEITATSTMLTLRFDQDIQQASAETTSNYALSGGQYVVGATQTSSDTVRLDISSLSSGVEYVLTINNIMSAIGVQSLPNATNVFTYVAGENIHILFDFGKTIYPTVGNWNNVDSLNIDLLVTNAIDVNGVSQPIDLRFLQPALTVGTSAGPVATNLYPDTAQRDCFYSTGPFSYQIEGADPSSLYRLTFFGSKSATLRETMYSVGGNSVVLDTGYNTNQTVVIENIESDANGHIIFTVEPNVTNSSGFGYLSVVELEGVAGAAAKKMQANVSALSIDEGTTNSFQLRLNSLPSGSVTASVMRATGDVQLSPVTTSAVFTTNNWNAWQTIYVESLWDSDTNNGIATIRCSDLDGTYALDDVAVTQIDQTPPAAIAPVADNQSVAVTADIPTNLVLTATDADSATLTYAIVTDPTHGSLGTLDANTGAVTYTPASYSGVDSFTFSASDGSLYATGTVSITVAPAPGAAASIYFDFGNTNYTTPGNWNNINSTAVDLLVTNAVDISGVQRGLGLRMLQPGTTVGFSSGVNVSELYPATAQRDCLYSTRPFSYQIEGANPSSQYRLIFFASKGAALRETMYSVGSSNVVLDCAYNTDRTAVIENVQSDANGDIVFTITTNVVNSSGFCYLSVLEIQEVSPPIGGDLVANGQSVTVDEDTATNLVLTASNAAGSLTYAIVAGPANGSTSGLDANTGAITYTPTANYSGADSFTFSAYDGSLYATGTVSLAINAINDAPVANNQSASTDAGVATNLVLTASDVDNTNLTYAIVAGPANGSLSGLDANTGAVTYTPSPAYSGSDGFTFSVFDGTLYATGSVSLAIAPVPVSAASIYFDFGSSTYLTPGNWNNIDSTTVDLLITNAVDSAGVQRGLGLRMLQPGTTVGFSWGNSASNLYPLSAQRDSVYSTRPFSYQIEGANPTSEYRLTFFASKYAPLRETMYSVGSSNVVLDCAYNTDRAVVIDGVQSDTNGVFVFTITTNVVNSSGYCYLSALEIQETLEPVAPVAGNQSVTIDEDVSTILVLTATDADSVNLVYSILNSPASGSLSGLDGNTGAVTYTPTANYYGADSFDFLVSDGTFSATGSVSLTVNSVNDTPIADDQSGTLEGDTSTNLVLTATDADNTNLTYAIVAGPANGTLSGLDANTGAVIYTPNAGYGGADRFTFSASDGSLSATGTVNLTVTPPPVPEASIYFDFGSSTYLTPGNWNNINSTTVGLLINNAVDSEGVARGIGLRMLQPSTTVAFSWGNSASNLYPISAQRDCVYSTKPFYYQIEGANPESEYRLTFFASKYAANRETMYSVGSSNVVLDCAYNTDRSVMIGGVYADTNGVITFTITTNEVNSSGFCYLSVLELQEITAEAPPADLVANNQNTATDEDTPANLVLTASNAAGSLTYAIVTGPVNGNLSGLDAGMGAVTYTAIANYSGADSFTFSAYDGSLYATGTVSLTINAVNDEPVADDQSTTIGKNMATNLVLTASDVDNTNLTYAVVAGPANGSLSGLDANTGAVTYTPTTDYSGADSFTFSASDGSLYATGTVSITISSTNATPVANAGADQQVPDQDDNGSESVTLNGAASSDSDGTILSYVWEEGATQIATGATPSVDFPVGVHTLTLTVADNYGATNSDTVVVTVSEPVRIVTFQIESSGDDAASDTNYTGELASTMYWPYSSASRMSFLRWKSLIPRGATITEAYVKVRANGVSGDSNPSVIRLQVMDFGNVPLFSSADNPFSDAVMTNYVDSTVSGSWETNAWNASSDITSLIQAYIARPDYVYGNYMGLRGSHVSGSWKRAYTWNYTDHSSAPQLEVHYTGGDVMLELWMADPETRLGQKVYCQLINRGSTDTLRVKLDDTVIHTQAAPLSESEEIFTVDYRTLGIGSHTLLVEILDAEGAVRTTANRTWTKLHDGIAKVAINENNAICRNGVPFFPITPWGIGAGAFPTWEGQINALTGQSFSIAKNLTGWTTFLESIRAYDYPVMGPAFGDYWPGGYTDNDVDIDGTRVYFKELDMNRVTEYINVSKNDPSMLMYVWHDEPDLGGPSQYIPATEVHRWTEKTHELDTQHPHYLNLVGYPFTQADPYPNYNNLEAQSYCFLFNDQWSAPMGTNQPFAKKTLVADVLAFDYYPYDLAYTAAYSNWIGLADLTLAIDRLREWNYNLAPTMTWIETCDVLPSVPNPPAPTATQLNNLIWLSIIHQVKGIQWFHYFQETSAENRAVMQTATEWITSLTQPILSAPEDVTWTVSNQGVSAGRVDFMTRQYNDRLYIFSTSIPTNGIYTNDMAATASVRFDMPGLTNGAQVGVLGESRIITASADYFEDTFSPLAVHIYTYPALTNLPPAAKAGRDLLIPDTDLNGSETVTLSDTGSFDPDGTITSYVWMEGASQIATGATVQVSLSNGTHVITLVVTDNGGETGSSTISVIVNPPPSAHAGVDQQVDDVDNDGFELITLDGSASTDDNPLASYVWIEDGNVVATGVTAQVSVFAATHDIKLEVTDRNGQMDSDIVQIIVVNPNVVNAQYQVAATGDDTVAYTNASGYLSSTMYFPYSSTNRFAFLRWPLNIPAGATILSADLQVQSVGTKGDENPSTVGLRLVDSDNSPSFVANPYYLPVTPTTENWVLAGEWIASQWYRSGNIKTLVQEFINRTNYTTNNYLGMRCENLSGSWKQAYQWDSGAHTNGAILSVTYLPAPEPLASPLAMAVSTAIVTDSDGDLLPNNWEELYFGGITNANPVAMAANGLNTVQEAYIAGLDPLDSSAVFSVANEVASSHVVLHWSSITGRVYSIYWSTNLLDTFQTLDTGIVWPQNSWTDEVHSVEDGGFYQIKVQLNP